MKIVRCIFPVRPILSARISSTLIVGDRRDVNFRDAEKATRGKTTWEVFRGWLVFKIFSYDIFVDNSAKLYHLSKFILGTRLTEKLLKLTAFGQFASGLDESSSMKTVKKLADQSVTSIWFYSIERDLEGKESPSGVDGVQKQEEIYEQVKDAYIRSIQMSASCNYSRDPKFMALKMTAMVSPRLLNKLNDTLVEAERAFLSHASPGEHKKDSHMNTDTLHRIFPGVCFSTAGHNKTMTLVDWNRHFCLVDNLENFRQLKMPEGEAISFSSVEQEQLSSLIRRLQLIGEAAERHGVSILMDAEQTYFQKAIEHFTLHLLSRQHNQADRPHPLFYNTLQTYLTNSYESMLLYLASCQRYGVTPALKIVRGCYMEQERQHAKSSGKQSPIHPTAAHTGASYHRCLTHVMAKVGENRARILVASHNEETVRRALALMEEYQIPPSDHRVSFGQLLGMADHLTLPLAQAGYHACKVVPYGSMDDIVPFLSRRANENRGIMKNAQAERILYAQELKRRLKRK